MLPFELPPPSGTSESPIWTGNGFLLSGKKTPVLEYSENFSGWSDDLTMLHEEAAGDGHPIDIASREDALRQLHKYLDGKASPAVLEIGCSSGFMLKAMRDAFPEATLVGADVVKAPLYRLAEQITDIPLIRFDLLRCPLPANSFDAVVILNVLEHIEDDRHAMAEIARLLKPGGVVIIEVPAGPKLYDAYDKTLMHFRRYEIKELAKKVSEAGFSISRRSHLGFFVYPIFAAVKRRNQLRMDKAAEMDSLVKQQASSTSNSFLLKILLSIERVIGKIVAYPVGIRCLVTASKD